MNVRSNSRSVSRLIYLGGMSEPITDAESGVYLGRTLIYKLPFFLDLDSLVNPHITIIGMTGSGKSHTLKSIIVRSVLQKSYNVVVLDWNNEYMELMGFVSGRVLSLGVDFEINIFDLYAKELRTLRSATDLVRGMLALDERQHSILYSRLAGMLSRGKGIDIRSLVGELGGSASEAEKELSARLSQLFGNPLFARSTNFNVGGILDGRYSINLSTLKDDTQRGEVARFVLGMVIESMHEMKLSGLQRRMVVLDEAWRLIRNSQEVGTLFREARKYGISVVAATQLASDINNEVLANSGCLAVFRLQSEADYSTLESIGVIGKEAGKALGDLGVGSCMLSLAYKGSASPSKFFIEKVRGIDLGAVMLRGERMAYDISYGRFVEISGAMLELKHREKVIAFVMENRKELEMSSFVRFLHGIGLSRADVVAYLHELGIEDREIVDAYET